MLIDDLQWAANSNPQLAAALLVGPHRAIPDPQRAIINVLLATRAAAGRGQRTRPPVRTALTASEKALATLLGYLTATPVPPLTAYGSEVIFKESNAARQSGAITDLGSSWIATPGKSYYTLSFYPGTGELLLHGVCKGLETAIVVGSFLGPWWDALDGGDFNKPDWCALEEIRRFLGFNECDLTKLASVLSLDPGAFA